MTSRGNYIWCYVATDGIITPVGSGKDLEYALILSERKNPSYKLYKLVDVEKEEIDEILS